MDPRSKLKIYSLMVLSGYEKDPRRNGARGLKRRPGRDETDCRNGRKSEEEESEPKGEKRAEPELLGKRNSLAYIGKREDSEQRREERRKSCRDDLRGKSPSARKRVS